jgi:hypothetical protein
MQVTVLHYTGFSDILLFPVPYIKIFSFSTFFPISPASALPSTKYEENKLHSRVYIFNTERCVVLAIFFCGRNCNTFLMRRANTAIEPKKPLTIQRDQLLICCLRTLLQICWLIKFNKSQCVQELTAPFL